jgi:hypothetical protein
MRQPGCPQCSRGDALSVHPPLQVVPRFAVTARAACQDVLATHSPFKEGLLPAGPPLASSCLGVARAPLERQRRRLAMLPSSFPPSPSYKMHRRAGRPSSSPPAPDGAPHSHGRESS